MRKRSLLLLAGAAAIVASLVVGPAATAGPEKASAGTVVFIHDQEPPNLRANWVDNNLYATALVLNNIWYGGQIRDNNAKWVTRLFTGPPKLVKKSPLTISFQYSPKANWSDGTPVTCADGVRTGRLHNTATRRQPLRLRGIAPFLKGRRHVRFRRLRRLEVAAKRRRLQAKDLRAQGDLNKAWENSVPVSRSVALPALAEGVDHVVRTRG